MCFTIYRIIQMNQTFERFPQEAAISLLACEIASIFGTHQLILASGVTVPAALALGFAVSRPFRRIRLPIELMFAAGLRRVVPTLAELKMTSLISGQVPSAVSSNPVVSKIRNWRGTVVLRDIIDGYGACYFIGARWTGVLSVLLFTGLISSGVEVDAILEKFGFSTSLASTLGSWAAAVTLSSFLYPVSMGVGGAILAPALGRFRVKYMAKEAAQKTSR